MSRNDYLRGSKGIDQRLTATAFDRVADWLDIADSKTRTAIYPEVNGSKDYEQLAHAWMWACVTLADVLDLETDILHSLATSARQIYTESE